jgi:hypothetical protein
MYSSLEMKLLSPNGRMSLCLLLLQKHFSSSNPKEEVFHLTPQGEPPQPWTQSSAKYEKPGPSVSYLTLHLDLWICLPKACWHFVSLSSEGPQPITKNKTSIDSENLKTTIAKPQFSEKIERSNLEGQGTTSLDRFKHIVGLSKSNEG